MFLYLYKVINVHTIKSLHFIVCNAWCHFIFIKKYFMYITNIILSFYNHEKENVDIGSNFKISIVNI